jgi:hypothetical protein
MDRSLTLRICLHRDLKNYQDTIVAFGFPALSERFEFLRQLGNVFLVRPDILKSYITENYLGRIEPALLRPYLAQRSDWAQFERAFDFGLPESSVLSPSDSAPNAPTNGLGSGDAPMRSALRDRLNTVNVSNRLSTMMRDLESIRIGVGHNIGSLQDAMNTMNAIGMQSFGLHPPGMGRSEHIQPGQLSPPLSNGGAGTTNTNGLGT